MFHESPGRAGKKRNLAEPLVVVWELIPFDFKTLADAATSEAVFARVVEELILGRRYDPEKDLHDAGSHFFWMTIPISGRLTAFRDRLTLERKLGTTLRKEGV